MVKGRARLDICQRRHLSHLVLVYGRYKFVQSVNCGSNLIHFPGNYNLVSEVVNQAATS
jgi:hypothetical protein